MVKSPKSFGKDSFMQILLIGEEKSKRSEYFMKAADALGFALKIIAPSYFSKTQASDFSILKGCAVKIDPPDMNSACINELNIFMRQYSLWLEKLQSIPNVRYLNTPQAIFQTLDKAYCKRVLLDVGLPTAPYFPEINSICELRQIVSEKKLTGVFIKPRLGSGAAGVIAYRRNPKTAEEVIYTTAQKQNERLYNTKKLRRICNTQEITNIVNGVLKIGAVTEKWIPKAHTNSKPYDIRAVWQFDKIKYAVARLSRGTITNLHIGGKSVNLDELCLSNQTLYEIEELCRNAVSCFPGLNVAGFDILLEQNTFKPYIIEINGQGDFMHKNLYCENTLYKDQLRYLGFVPK
jgi:glutathione synthase/RimK-type ligase-like ATP-grasp enzyme